MYTSIIKNSLVFANVIACTGNALKLQKNKIQMFLLTLQAALVIRGLFICEFAYSHLKNDLKWHFSSQKWTFYLWIQDSRSKMTDRIYRE